MPFTSDQLRAINHLKGNLQLIACAGSGKTEVVARRIVNLLKPGEETSVLPFNIVAFTFTDRAAAELKDRIVTRATEALGAITGIAEMYVGTIHGYCLHLLHTYLFEFLKYSVLTDVQTRLLVSRNSTKSGLSGVEIISGPSTGQKLTRGPQDVKVFLDALNVIREDDVQFAKLPKGLNDAFEHYEELLDRHRYLDYSRIMVETLAALCDRSDPIRVRFQETVASDLKHLVVDEYQDVNPLQEALIRRLHELGATVCVVGDDDQTIYQWRGSEIRNILEFSKRYPKVTDVTIAENFRSSAGVVDTAKLIAEINRNRLPKKMAAGGHQKFNRGDMLALSFKNPGEEAKWMAEHILALQGSPFVDEPGAEPRGLSWSDCAVLLRSVRRSGDAITAAFKDAGIPYVISGLSNLFDAAEVQAAAILFSYIVGEVGDADVKAAWRSANLALNDADLSAGLVVLDKARSWKKGERWGAYNIQRTYLSFLEAVNFREDRVPPTKTRAARGEIVYSNLGKFSQLISDFEQIYFQSEPQEKYNSFVWWLTKQAPNIYEEGGEDVGFAQPDAVQVMTVHQAKGMEWPAVFVPALQKNRFPSTAGGKGRSKWHILPRAAVPDAARYDGSVEDERRLFYVALTRSKKFLYCTFAPTPKNQLYQQPSEFLTEFIRSPNVLTRPVPVPTTGKLKPRPKRETPNVVLSFSQLKYFFECPYQFKLRFLYGFNPPLHEALGFGKSIHDALAEVHKRAKVGDILGEKDAESLVDGHLHTPFAYPALRDQLREAAVDAVARYLREQGPALPQTLHSEQQVEIQVSPGITVNGRIDLIKRIDTGEVAIVDFKSTERAQAEDVTRAQLHTYAMGYHQLTGKNADLVEVLNLDKKGKSVREVVDDGTLKATEADIRRAGSSIRANNFERLKTWCDKCHACDVAGICRKRERVDAKSGGAGKTGG
jgi:DNA helicase-2/ATP-dependent DNA helicase PcrA